MKILFSIAVILSLIIPVSTSAYGSENEDEYNDPCNYYGLNVCNDKGVCDDERFDCYSDDCVDGQPGTTGMCDGDDDKDCWDNGEWNGKCDTGNEEVDEDEETANCGGEPCTPTEKEDSWLD